MWTIEKIEEQRTINFRIINNDLLWWSPRQPRLFRFKMPRWVLLTISNPPIFGNLSSCPDDLPYNRPYFLFPSVDPSPCMLWQPRESTRHQDNEWQRQQRILSQSSYPLFLTLCLCCKQLHRSFVENLWLCLKRLIRLWAGRLKVADNSSARLRFL